MSGDLEASVFRKVGRRLIPFLGVLYFAAFLDRVNVGFAALQMNRDLGFNAAVYGFGAGIFFIGYCLFEVPSNLCLHRFGGRRWISRIMLTWGVIGAVTAFVPDARSFFALRFVLGIAEAGFFPGIIYYLTNWVPAPRRARVVSAFMTAVPVSTAIGGPLSSAILALDGRLGLAGWQWLFLLETVPSLVLGFAAYRWLPDSPREARWLSEGERRWLLETIERERGPAERSRPLGSVLLHPRILALGACYFGFSIGLYGVILWLPQILHSVGLADRWVGIGVAVPYGLAAAGMVLWSRHSDRRDERRWHLAGAALLACAGLLASAFLGDTPRLAVVSMSVAAVGTLAVLPVFWTLPAALVSGVEAAAAIALINAIGNIGGFVGPYLIGWIKDATGQFTWGLVATALAMLASGLFALVLARTAPAGGRRAAAQSL